MWAVVILNREAVCEVQPRVGALGICAAVMLNREAVCEVQPRVGALRVYPGSAKQQRSTLKGLPNLT